MECKQILYDNRSNMKFPKLFFVTLFIYVPIILFSIIMTYTGKFSMTMNGYGVDSFGKLYIGKETRIEVYENKKMLYTIYPMTKRAYEFTVQDDDTLLLSTSTYVYILDLHGEVLHKEVDKGTKTFNKLQWLGMRFVASNGDTYIRKWNFCRTKIDKVDGKESYTVYIMPVWEYIFKLLVIFACVFFAVSLPVILLKVKGKNLKDVICFIKHAILSGQRKNNLKYLANF